jgi:hypothetical protein
MISLELHEAQLFRVLTSFFGVEQVIPHMSVMAICGGVLPETIPSIILDRFKGDIVSWAKKSKCLFTVVDNNDSPKLVVEFFCGFEKSIDNRDIDAQTNIKPILELKGVQYITISIAEFNEILDPEGNMDFYQWLNDKWQPNQKM